MHEGRQAKAVLHGPFHGDRNHGGCDLAIYRMAISGAQTNGIGCVVEEQL